MKIFHQRKINSHCNYLTAGLRFHDFFFSREKKITMHAIFFFSHFLLNGYFTFSTKTTMEAFHCKNSLMPCTNLPVRVQMTKSNFSSKSMTLTVSLPNLGQFWTIFGGQKSAFRNDKYLCSTNI